MPEAFEAEYIILSVVYAALVCVISHHVTKPSHICCQAQGLGSYAANLNRQTSVDPIAMLRGGSQFSRQGLGERNALFNLPQEQVTRINPDAGVNIGMQDLANRANYQAANYAAREQAAGGMAQGLFGAIGTGLGGFFQRQR